ncbi:MAG TPA: hypothetical protein VN843_27835, partial [Anaerolineales bacterium]|nr:hypothetical protein [Anaerolineales bacterium]
AKQLNDLVRRGELTREEVDEIIEGNDNLAIEEMAEPTIVFDKVEILQSGGSTEVANTGKRNEYSGTFTVDPDVPTADPKGVITIKVTFHAIDATLNKDYESVTTTNEKNRRWNPVDEHGGKPGKESDYGAKTGTIIFKIRQSENGGKNNSFKVKVGADYTASIFVQGSRNKQVYAEATIRIVPGSSSPFRF